MKSTDRVRYNYYSIDFACVSIEFITKSQCMDGKWIAFISRKTKCSTFAKHFVPKSHLLTQFKM